MSTAASFVPVDPTGTVLGDEVYARLGEAILDGRLAAGERLRDVDLATWLGVSRTPVREALQRLERIGLVEVAAHRYTRVSTPSDAVRHDTQEFAALFLGNAVGLAVPRCSDEVLTDAVAIVDEIIEASRADDHDAIIAASTRLFVLIVIATENAAFLRVMEEGDVAIRRNLGGWHPSIECPIERTAEYVSFREAVVARDGSGAEAILRRIHGLR